MIRAATVEDADDMIRVHIEGWRTAYRDLFSPEFLAGISHETRKIQWLQILNKNEVDEFAFVVESAGKVVGFINGGLERTGDPDFDGEIYALYLLEEFRRRGIGLRLFLRCIQFLVDHDMHSMKVWVLSDNPYRHFYEKQGGHVIAEKAIDCEGKQLIETAYGWTSLTAKS